MKNQKHKDTALYELYLKIVQKNQNQKIDDLNLELNFFNIVFHLIEDYESFSPKFLGELIEMTKSFRGDTNEFFQYVIDDLICLVMAHYDKNLLSKTPGVESLESPVFKILKKIIEIEDEKGETEFVNEFEDSIIELEEYFIEKQLIDTASSNYVTFLIFDLLYASIIHDRRIIIDKIIEKENFSLVDIRFPSNIKTYKGSLYAAQKILEHTYGDLLDFIPKTWLTVEVFNRFLDTRVTRDPDENIISFDTTFLIHQYTKRQQVLTKEDLSSKLVFWDDFEGLDFIRKNKPDCLNHPVLATYVELKNHKYQRIFQINFVVFFIMFISYIIYINSVINCGNDDICLKESITGKVFGVMIPVVYMFLREIFQLFMYNDGSFIEKFTSHFSPKKNTCNIFEAILMISMTLTMIFDTFLFQHKLFECISAMNIIIYVSTMTSMFPYAFMSFHVRLLQKTFYSFLKFLATFALLLFSYLKVLEMFFGKKYYNSDNEFTKNFQNSSSGVLKVFMMLSGEFGAEPYKFNIYEIFVFFSFVTFTYILFNLLIGLTFDDVQEMKQNVMKIVMKSQIDRLNITNKVFKTFLNNNQ